MTFYRAEAEAVPDLSRKYEVTIVPTFILIDANGNIFDRVDGGDDVASVTQAVTRFSRADSSASTTEGSAASPPLVTPEERLNSRLKDLTSSAEVMLFMKGSPAAPKCGFSRQTVEILAEANIAYGTFDILSDEAVRQGLKKYSDWPTYPQLYVRGELMGGLDIIKELAAEEGGLPAQLEVQVVGATKIDGPASSEPANKAAAPPTLIERIEKIIARHHVMLFMKGLPSAPQCGFSRTIVGILDDLKVSYDSFNILEDYEVREGLKEFSDWPTYPQLYVEGELVGGLDIVKEMLESGDLEEMLKPSS